VTAVIDGVEGPFIDGRGYYYTPEAAAKPEAYHDAVLALRRVGETDPPALPEIAGVTGRLVDTIAAAPDARASAAEPSED